MDEVLTNIAKLEDEIEYNRFKEEVSNKFLTPIDQSLFLSEGDLIGLNKSTSSSVLFELGFSKLLDKDNYPFEYVKGNIPVLITAPHSTKHFRPSENKIYKEEDEFTAGMALELGKVTGAHVLYLKYKSREDPNHDKSCLFKESLKEIVRANDIRFIIDLHGAKRHDDFLISVGTRGNKEEVSSCKINFTSVEQGLKDIANFNLPSYKGLGEGTIITFAKEELNIEAIQVEIVNYARIIYNEEYEYWGNEEKILLVFSKLKDLIIVLSKIFRQ